MGYSPQGRKELNMAKQLLLSLFSGLKKKKKTRTDRQYQQRDRYPKKEPKRNYRDKNRNKQFIGLIY